MITIFNLIAGFSGGGSQQINDILFTFKKIQRTNVPIELEAYPVGNVAVTEYRWEIRRMSDDALVGLSFDKLASIDTVNTVGWYYVLFTAKTNTDQYVRRWDDIRVGYPRFEEADADIVVNLASGNYFQNFAEADNSGLKIYVKGSGTAQFQVTGLFGTSGNPVLIQKAEDNTNIEQVCPGGTPHALYLYGNNQFISIDGFNADGTNGWDIEGAADGAQIVASKDGYATDIDIMGINTSHTSSVNAASFSFIPIIDATYQATTVVADNMSVFHCNILDAGEEGIYMGYNSDLPISGRRPLKFRNAIIAWNNIYRSGRDSIQPGSCVNIRVHDNYLEGWGVQADASHESAISWNGGTYGKCYRNYCINGEMFWNIQSGGAPWDILAGQTTPQPTEFYSNVCISGTYTGSPGTEPFAIYIQNSGSETTSSANWPVSIYGNTIKSDKKIAEAYFHASSFVWTGFKMVNNICVGTTSGGDYPEINFTGPGTQPTGSTVNNIFKTPANQSDIGFTNYAGNDLTIASLSSIAYTGATDISSYTGKYDQIGVPLSADGYAHGAYSGYQKKTITPTTGDPNPATFTGALAVGSLTNTGGTITFEANKVGLLYWVVVTNGDTAPSITQIRAGLNAAGTAAIKSGQIIDAGTASSGVISGLTEGTPYDLYAVFVTIDNVPQAVPTKVDFSTTADVTAPVLSAFNIPDANRDRIYFDSSEIITGTTYGGFTIATPTKTINGLVINSGQLTGHYFTVSVPFVFGEAPTIAYSGSGSNIQDVATSPNALASFTATAITNNIQPEAAEPVVVNLNDDITVSGTNSNDFTSTSTSAYVTSTQIIPSTSNGYIEFDWDQDTRNASAIRIGFIDEADGSPVANDVKLWLALSSANHNIDIYEGGTYKSTYSTFGYNQAGTKYRISIDRATQKITAKASSNNWSSSVTLYTSTTNFTGDFRYVFHTTVNGAQAMNNYIQADLGLT